MNFSNKYEYEKRFEDLSVAQKKWIESEWRLTFLRSITGKPVKEISDDELLEWNQHKNNYINTSQTLD